MCVADNIALGKPAWQSSNAYRAMGFAYMAVDGSKGYHMGWNQCIQTAREANAWWAVDLYGEAVVSAIIILNRDDALRE
jgi:hypothetical protein